MAYRVGQASATALGKQVIGTPYVLGTPVSISAHSPASPPRSFDCSGLVEWTWYWSGGQHFPFHNSQEMYSQLEAQKKLRPYAERQPGDAVFYDSGPGTVIHHVALVSDNTANVIQAPEPGTPVQEVPDYSTPGSRRRPLVGIYEGAGFQGVAGGTTTSTPDPSSSLSTYHYLPPGKASGVNSKGVANSWPAWFSGKSDKTVSGHPFYPVYNVKGIGASDLRMMYNYFKLMDTPGGPVFNGGAAEKEDAIKRTASVTEWRSLNDNDRLNTWVFYNTTLHDIGVGGREDSGATGAPGVKQGINAYRDVAGFLSVLTSAALWLRIAEGILGIAIAGVAVAHLSGNQNPISKVVGAKL